MRKNVQTLLCSLFVEQAQAYLHHMFLLRMQRFALLENFMIGALSYCRMSYVTVFQLYEHH